MQQVQDKEETDVNDVVVAEESIPILTKEANVDGDDESFTIPTAPSEHREESHALQHPKDDSNGVDEVLLPLAEEPSDEGNVTMTLMSETKEVQAQNWPSGHDTNGVDKGPSPPTHEPEEENETMTLKSMMQETDQVQTQNWPPSTQKSNSAKHVSKLPSELDMEKVPEPSTSIPDNVASNGHVLRRQGDTQNTGDSSHLPGSLAIATEKSTWSNLESNLQSIPYLSADLPKTSRVCDSSPTGVLMRLLDTLHTGNNSLCSFSVVMDASMTQSLWANSLFIHKITLHYFVHLLDIPFHLDMLFGSFFFGWATFRDDIKSLFRKWDCVGNTMHNPISNSRSDLSWFTREYTDGLDQSLQRFHGVGLHMSDPLNSEPDIENKAAQSPFVFCINESMVKDPLTKCGQLQGMLSVHFTCSTNP
jgi:hypothetical protein